MNRAEALKVAEQFKAIGGFSEILVQHFGFIASITPESEIDGKWTVELWSVNGRAGNRTLHVVREAPKSEREVKLIAKAAKGKASERDRAALARIATERSLDRE